jgi:hypothetical protein
MANVKIQRSYYENGLLRGECSVNEGKSVGTTRLWHENGVLSWECPFDNGLENGLVRQWNRDGNILGEYRMYQGTGFSKHWYENGQLERESYSIGGKLCGRFRCWMEDGNIVSTTYYIMDKAVSKRKYEKACLNDPTLPRYEDGRPKPKCRLPSTKYRKRKISVSEEERDKHNKIIADFRGKSNQAEARQWLANNENRNVGEMTPDAAREVIEGGYKAGAIRITAVDIQGDTTDCLIVELPQKGNQRKEVFEWNNELALSSGFDPDDDWGQSELFVYFS